MSGLKAVVSLSLAAVIGLTLLVLACVLTSEGTWWPMFVIVFYLLSPLPILIARNVYDCEFNVASPGIEFALFATTGIVFSAFALPFILAHAGVINFFAYSFTFVANLVLFATVYGFMCYFNAEDENFSLW
uniref:Leptin receptor gene-related protein n=1 Tax=Bursaphelenchus xylophilus TaxID=6326 RepID=A0A1I7SVV2_BURXY